MNTELWIQWEWKSTLTEMKRVLIFNHRNIFCNSSTTEMMKPYLCVLRIWRRCTFCWGFQEYDPNNTHYQQGCFVAAMYSKQTNQMLASHHSKIHIDLTGSVSSPYSLFTSLVEDACLNITVELDIGNEWLKACWKWMNVNAH